MTDLTVAKTIREQLGRQFTLMTGATNFVGDIDSLRFRIPQSKHGINKVLIRLEPSDTYTMVFCQGCEIVSSFEDVYFDQLQDIFERETGLYTTLTARG
jgi:hypothetical protein